MPSDQDRPSRGFTGQKTIRYVDFVHEVDVHAEAVSYNLLTPKLQVDAQGRPGPYVPP